MSPSAQWLVGWVAFIHLVIAVMEMAFWRFPQVHGRLGYTQADADRVAPIVRNAGLYNSFLAAGLTWCLVGWHYPEVGLGASSARVALFFLWCVVVAGVVGALTLKWTTLIFQTVFAALGVAAIAYGG